MTELSFFTFFVDNPHPFDLSVAIIVRVLFSKEFFRVPWVIC